MMKPVASWLFRTLRRHRGFFRPLSALALRNATVDYWYRSYVEKLRYQDVTNVHDLPPIFHYWSNKYLLPKFQEFGFHDPDSFFVKYLHEAALTSGREEVRFASIGSGNGDTEIRIALALRQLGLEHFSIRCIDLNPAMLRRCKEMAKQNGLDRHIIIEEADFNHWRPQHDYDAIMANQSLHHVTRLEGLFDAVKEALTPAGLFVISDMIGRNGHSRWPEALAIVKAFWSELPQNYHCNRLTGEQEETFINRDCSVEGFEGIRAQDILPLLIERFSFDLFLGFSNVISPFIDRCFGPNFSIDNEWDREFIDRVHARDESELLSGNLKPTQMVAVVRKGQGKEVFYKNMDPASCVRDPAWDR
ncbi:MAG: class I SAM-dependent methyltransferase [Betaproteobacteria bacterium]|nr:class I SAM-dependent methyltransferase [Betaproteobacteria bacterium]